jgi:L-threonylcarbamoyladenylate synthase
MSSATDGPELAAVAARVATGGVVVIPTDTVYGLACDPRSAAAADRIYTLKRRPADLELSLLAAAVRDLEPVVELTEPARRLAERHWPGALSLILQVRATDLAVPRRGTTLMVRVPGHDLLRRLLALTGPLASTSANRHGEPPAGSAEEARAIFGAEVDAVLDGGPGAGTPSTIIDMTETPPRVLREGLIAGDELVPFLRG